MSNSNIFSSAESSRKQKQFEEKLKDVKNGGFSKEDFEKIKKLLEKPQSENFVYINGIKRKEYEPKPIVKKISILTYIRILCFGIYQLVKSKILPTLKVKYF